MKRIPLKPHASAGINLDLIIPVSNYLEGVRINDLGREIFSVPENAPIIARMEKNECLIDFAGPHRNVYRVTVSEDHDMQLTGLKELLISSGHCEEYNGSLMEAKNASTIEKIKFHWVIPAQRRTSWIGKKAKTKQARTTTEMQTVKECLDNYVEQYVIVMDNEPL